MVFKCQEDSFLKEFTGKIVRCEPTKEPIVDYGKVAKFEGYQVLLDNTIIFPAGGGQPHDIGWLNDQQVYQVLRQGSEALHFVKEPIEVGTQVTQKIDWNRRFDHMQQHSGQHLLSAILEKEHNLNTTSWWLGAEESFVELDTKEISEVIVKDTVEKCNDMIRQALPVEVRFCKIDDPGLDKAHTRGLPKDCMETIRIICIGDYDQNMCCGTHVSNLSQLQMLTVLGWEPGKKGKTNLRFLVGNRVATCLRSMLDRERALVKILNNEPSKHEELVQKLHKNLKITNKNLQNALQELAEKEVEKIKMEKPKCVFMFKKEATQEYRNVILKGLEKEDIFLVLVSEDLEKPNEGPIVIKGPEEHCSVLGSQITEILKAKGKFNNGKFQGKASDLSGIKKCKKLVEGYFNNP